MTLTRARIIQYIGILLALGLIAVGYWYFAVRAGVNVNTGATQSAGTDSLANGLGAYWKFDENTGTSTTDGSVNGATGTLTNGPTWTTGQIGYAVDFDGTDDYVTTPDADPLELALERSKFTIAGWFNRDTFTTDDTIVAKRNGITAGDSGYIVYIDDATDQLIFEFSDGVDEVSSVSTTTFTATGWHHFVITQLLDVDGNPRVYIDGQLEAASITGNINDMEPAGTALAFRIGAETDAGNPFDGKLDEIRYYHTRALKAEQVAELYRLTAPTGVDTSLKGYWSFDGEERGDYVYDQSGSGNRGTPFGTGTMPAPTPAAGRLGQALSFDGTDDYIGITPSASLNNIANMTACIWSNSTGATDGSLISKDDSTTGWNIVGNSTTISSITFYKGWSGGVGYAEWRTADGVLPNNQWSHVCVTYANSSTANDPIIYVNGVSVPITEINAPSGTVIDDSTFSPAIGSYGSGMGAFFDGRLDEARIYNRILTAAEIKSLYNMSAPDKTNTNATQAQGGAALGAGLALYWPLDEGSGTNADDKGVGQNDGTLTNGPTWTTGQIGSAVDFDGTNDYVAVADPASGVLDFTLPSDNGNGDIFNVSLWFNRDTATTDDTLFAKKDDPATGDGYLVFIDDADDKIYTVVQSTTDTPDISTSYTTTTYTSTGWHHLVVTFDEYLSAGGFFQCPRVYVDGTDVTDPASCGNYMHYTGNIANSLAFTVGAESDGGNPFDGKLDDVRVYTRPLTNADIELLNRGTTQTSGIDTGLRGYWSFDAPDTSASLTSWGVYDRSGWGNWGAVTNSPAIVRGRVGQAIRLDGANDHVSVPAASPLNDQHTFTYAAWIYPTGASCGNGYGRIIEKGTGSGVKKSLYIDCSGASGDRALLGTVDTATTDALSYTASGALVYNEWQHVAMTYDDAGDRKVRLYINGREQPYAAQTAGTGAVATDSTDSIAIGATPGTQFYAFIGMIDEPRIYSRVLTAGELSAISAAGAPDKMNTSVSTPQGTGRLDSGLAGYWKLDENTGTSVADASTNGNTGTLTNGPTWTTGQIGSAVNFDGTNDYISTATTIPNQGSVSVWVNGTMALNGARVYHAVSAGASGNWFLLGANVFSGYNGFYFRIRGGFGTDLEIAGPQYTSDAQIQGWHHLTATWDTSKGVSLYIDGALADTSTTTTSNFDSMSTYIGSATASETFLGKIDEPRLYDRVLSADEVAQLYRLAAPSGTDTSLKGYWSFNGSDMNGTTAYDRSGGGNNGTLTGGPTRVRGKLGQALDFDETDDYVTMGDPSNLEGFSAVSLSAWVNPVYSDFTQAIVAKEGVYKLDIGVLGNIRFLTGNDWAGSILEVTPDSSYEYYGEWHHIVATYDGATKRMYIDGVLSPTTVSTTGGVGTNINTFTIGAYHGPNNYADSLIDEVRVYNRALSASEVKALYNSGR